MLPYSPETTPAESGRSSARSTLRSAVMRNVTGPSREGSKSNYTHDTVPPAKPVQAWTKILAPWISAEYSADALAETEAGEWGTIMENTVFDQSAS